jgi:hypothetical protein
VQRSDAAVALEISGIEREDTDFQLVCEAKGKLV